MSSKNKSKVAAEYKCSSCGVVYNKQKGNFFSTKSELYKNNNYYVTICRNCAEEYFKKLLGFFNGNIEMAMRRCCQLFDWPYSDRILAATRETAAGTSRIAQYPSKMNMVQFKSIGTTYEDTIKEDAGKPQDLSDNISDEDIDVYKVPLKTINFFGPGYTNEQYRYLQEQYSDWVARYECETKAKEELYKAISISQLRIHEIQENGGTGKELEAAVKTFQSLLDSQDITPKKANAGVTEGQETFGTLIRKLENERPVSEPQEQWKDVDGINKYIDTYFFGQLCELVDIQNPREEEYLAEKSKYTITPPQQDDSFGGNESSLLDKLAKRKDGGNELGKEEI